MDMASKFRLLRTSTLLFEILSLFEFFMRKIQSCDPLLYFFGVCQASPFPGQEAQ